MGKNTLNKCKHQYDICPPSISKGRSPGHYTQHYKRGKYNLKQADFECGTYRMTKPGYYRLCEDIVFDPRSNFDYQPEFADPLYSGPQYHLGFFAALTVEADHVTIDLNGHSLKQSNMHALQQPFYAHIELASAPFIPPQGPGDFGQIVSANDVAVVNGCLGLSSHHGVHGNGMTRTLFKDLIIKDFEVAAIHLNGGECHTICNVRAGPSRQDKPVLGTYSAGRFIRSFLRTAAKELSSSSNRKKAGRILRNLQKSMDKARDDILKCGKTSDPLWHNPHGTTDGNVYGIVFNPIGVAVAGLQATEPTQYISKINVNNVEIFGLRAEVDEVIAISKVDGTGAQNDPAGALFRIDEWSDSCTGKYVPNVLGDAMLFLAKHKDEMSFIGKLNITRHVVAWSECKITKKQLLTKYDYQYKCNGDTMFHVNKGILPLRVDGVKDASFKKVYIHCISNQAPMGNHILCGKYMKSHDEQTQKGYSGGDIKAVCVSMCKNLDFKNIHIDGLKSLNGIASGFDIDNSCKSINIYCAKIGAIHAGTRDCKGRWRGKNYYGKYMPYTGALPNLMPTSYGIKWSGNSDVKCKCVVINKDMFLSPGKPKAMISTESGI